MMSAAAADESMGGIARWIVDVIESVGAAGVGVLIALENVFPPIPSEVVLPFAGFSAARGDINVVAAWVAATAGAVAGALVLYALGALIGYDRLHALAARRSFVLFSQRDLARGERLFSRHADKIVLVGRCVPLVRSIVSVPAGIERMPLGRFTLLTAIGSGVWNAVFIGAGYRLGERWGDVQHYIAPVGYGFAALLAAGALWIVVRRLRPRGRP